MVTVERVAEPGHEGSYYGVVVYSTANGKAAPVSRWFENIK